MAKQESPRDVLDSYRKRQQRSERAPMLILISAAVLLIAGAAIIIFWLTGSETPQLGLSALFASETPTLTATNTATPIPPTLTPTETATPVPPTDTPEPSLTPTRSGPVIYVVEEGDTFYSIAAQFEVDVTVLIDANRERLELDPASPIIKIGDEILVPPPGAQLPTPSAQPEDLPPGTLLEYSILPGDTLQGIALKFNSTVEDIIKRNEALEEDPNAIFVGQVLEIRVNLVTPVPTAEEVEETATTEAGEGSVSTLTPTP
jgi:LysM repeat protein